jgi:DNA-binding response OmpR family regulator
VLVVDDDEVIRQLIAVNLQLEGFEVDTAVDGQDCLDKVESVRPDVITLDVMMARLDGWVTAVKLRDNPATEKVKVVMITARAQEHDIQRGHEIGVDAYVTKPFDPTELIRIVRDLAAERIAAERAEESGRVGDPPYRRDARASGQGPSLSAWRNERER